VRLTDNIVEVPAARDGVRRVPVQGSEVLTELALLLDRQGVLLSEDCE